jgi:hypothetical protein
MRAWRVLLTSVVVHAAVIAAWAWWWDRVAPVAFVAAPPRETPVAVEIVPPPQILEVAFLDDRSESPAVAPVTAPIASAAVVPVASSVHASVRRASSGIAIAAASAGTSEVAAGRIGEGSGAGPHHGLGMRGPELHPSDESLGHIAEQPGHQGTTPITSHRLDDAPNGRQVIHDAVTEITVDRDGTAHLHDKGDATAHIDINPLKVVTNVKDLGKLIADWAVDPEAGKRYGRTQDLSRVQQATEGGCGWGDSMCDDQEAPDMAKRSAKRGVGAGAAALLSIGGNLDVTSYLMKKLGVGDAYYARKLEALDDTRLERAEKGAAFKDEQLAHSAQLMQANLERVWAGTRNPDERKAVLFELWDECAEGEGPTGAAGDRARAMVIAWIRAQLPAGTAAAFTSAELALLDGRRTSHQHFAPYGERN